MPILAVAPHWGAWIEMWTSGGYGYDFESHPTGVRGLKFSCRRFRSRESLVAPHWGAWIEIHDYEVIGDPRPVAPHWGAWIEMSTTAPRANTATVAPHWGAWIEISSPDPSGPGSKVAPHWGAWIEIGGDDGYEDICWGRTPLGCVD